MCVCGVGVHKLLSLQTCGHRSFNAKWDRTSGWTSAPRNLVSYFGTITSQFSGEVADVAIVWTDFKTTDPNHNTRYPKKGVGYEPLGRVKGKLSCKTIPDP